MTPTDQQPHSTTSLLASELIHFASNGDLDACVQVFDKVKQRYPNISVRSLINETDDNGNTALHWACYRKHIDVVKYLVSKGADTDIPNTEQHQTPLHWACISGDPHLVYYLIGHGADIYKRDKMGLNSLLISSHQSDVHIVRYLLYKGMSVSSKDDEGHTALHWAAFCGHVKLIRYFIRKGADIHCVDNLGRTPFHWAAYKGYIEATKVLFEEGSSLSIRDNDNRTPYELALTRSTDPVLKFLKQEEQKKQSTPTAKGGYQNNTFWIILALVGNILFFSIAYSFKIYFSIPLMICVGNLARIVLANFWSDDSLNPLPVAWWIISCTVCYWAYFYLVVWAIPLYYLTYQIFLNDPNGPAFTSGSYLASMVYYYDNHRLISIFIIYGIIAWMWIWKLLSAQLLGISFNYTINEVVNMTKYKYLRKDGKWNVFNRGLVNNIHEFLYEYKKWYSTFTC
eukprot:gene9025-10585_t